MNATLLQVREEARWGREAAQSTVRAKGALLFYGAEGTSPALRGYPSIMAGCGRGRENRGTGARGLPRNGRTPRTALVQDQDGAARPAQDLLRDVGPEHPLELRLPPATDHYQPGVDLLGEVNDLFLRPLFPI